MTPEQAATSAAFKGIGVIGKVSVEESSRAICWQMANKFQGEGKTARVLLIQT